MKHLIIYSHINPKSFTTAIVEMVSETVISNGGKVKIIDLYKDEFNPVLNQHDIEFSYKGKEIPKDIKKYQELITWADKLTIVYPLWWGQMPAQLKGFFDRVFTNNFAFEYTKTGPNGLLKDKVAQVFINTGTPSEVYEKTGMHKSIDTMIKDGLFSFCGIDAEITYFGSVTFCPDEQRKEYLETVKKMTL